MVPEVGMKVWLQRDKDKDVEKLWLVTKVGLINEHGYALDINIKNPFGEELKVSGVSSWSWDSFPRVAIFPEKQPKILKDMKHLRAILDGTSEELMVICTRCASEVTMRVMMEEISHLRIADCSNDGRGEFFTESQPEVDDSSRTFSCCCDKNTDLDQFDLIDVESYT